VLHVQDNDVWLFYKVGPTVHDWITRRVISSDRGQTWSAPQPLVPGETLPRGPVRNKLLVMSNGEWIAPASIETETAWDAFADISTVGGGTWERRDVPIDHGQGRANGRGETWAGLAAAALWENDVERVFKWDGVIQPTLWESSPGVIHMLMRSTRGRIYRSDSPDFGRTWCPAYATPLPNNNSGIDLARLDDGRLVLAFNPIGVNWGRRYPISLATSLDGGGTWEHFMDLETEEGEFSYPAIIADDGILHLAYTWNRRNIVHWRIEIE
jgi:predicted neuraminidase